MSFLYIFIIVWTIFNFIIDSAVIYFYGCNNCLKKIIRHMTHVLFPFKFNAERQYLLWYMSTKYLLKEQRGGVPFFFIVFGILSQVSKIGRSLHEDHRIHWVIYWKSREISSEIAQEMPGKQKRWSIVSWELLSHFHNFLYGVSIRKVLGVNPCTYTHDLNSRW